MSPDLDTLFTVLAHNRRRELLLALRDAQPPHDTTCLSLRMISPEDLHNHLPRLDSHNIIKWDKEDNTITPGQNWGEIEPILTTITNHYDSHSRGDAN